MILLLGGTAETAVVAKSLAERGYSVLVSTATEIPLEIGEPPNIQRRSGTLEEQGLIDLISRHNLKAIIDVTHPYALEISRLAAKVSKELRIPYFRLNRPEVLSKKKEILRAVDHEQAASLAISKGAPVLLTTGSKNLEPYVRETTRAGQPLIVRVLPDSNSVQACLQAGIPREAIVTGRGPYSVKENRALIRKYNIGVLVTKDSGLPGGVLEKIQAAEQEGCQVIVVIRSNEKGEKTFEHIDELVKAVSKKFNEAQGEKK